jgi:hypothetical protein
MAGIFDISQQQQNSALGGLLTASHLQTARETAGKQLEAQKRQAQLGMAASGAAIGGMAGASSAAMGAKFGSAAGPIGAVAGLAIGYLIGELM